MTSALLACAGTNNIFRDLGFPEAEAQNLLLRADLVKSRTHKFTQDQLVNIAAMMN